MIKLTFLKALMLIRQLCQKKYIICHYWYYLDEGFKSQPTSVNATGLGKSIQSVFNQWFVIATLMY